MDGTDRIEEVLHGDGNRQPPVETLSGIRLPGYGYRWIRLTRVSRP